MRIPPLRTCSDKFLKYQPARVRISSAYLSGHVPPVCTCQGTHVHWSCTSIAYLPEHVPLLRSIPAPTCQRTYLQCVAARKSTSSAYLPGRSSTTYLPRHMPLVLTCSGMYLQYVLARARASSTFLPGNIPQLHTQLGTYLQYEPARARTSRAYLPRHIPPVRTCPGMFLHSLPAWASTSTGHLLGHVRPVRNCPDTCLQCVYARAHTSMLPRHMPPVRACLGMYLHKWRYGRAVMFWRYVSGQVRIGGTCPGRYAAATSPGRYVLKYVPRQVRNRGTSGR